MPSMPSILVVDDQVDNLKVLFNTLKQEYRVRVASSGAEALTMVRQSVRQSAAPDLFLLDIMMPEMDGYDLCRQLKRLPGIHQTPVIFLTARDRPEDEELGFEVGAADYVTKPMNARLVQARIKAQLALAGQIKQSRQILQASNELVARVIRERDDQTTQNALLVREIAERERAETALRASQARFARLTSQLGDRLFFFTNAPDGKLLYLSEGFKALLDGVSADEAIGQSWCDLADWSAESLAKLHEARWLWLSQGDENARFELAFRHPDGDWRQLEIHAYRICDEGRELDLIEGIALDVTQQRVQDARLRIFWRAVERAPVSITVTDIYGNIVYVNPHFTQLSGYSSEEAIGKNSRFLNSGEQGQPFYRQIWTTLERGETWCGELVNRNKQGQSYCVESVISPVFDEDGVLRNYIVVKQDIKDRKELEQIREDVERILRRDLKAPLHPIINLSEMLLIDESLSEEKRQDIDLIRQSARDMFDLIDLSLDLLKMESGQFQSSASHVDHLRMPTSHQ